MWKVRREMMSGQDGQGDCRFQAERPGARMCSGEGGHEVDVAWWDVMGP